MDFGSVAEARVRITDRRQALALQETAEQMCTPFFRAPELFNISSDCTIGMPFIAALVCDCSYTV